MKIKIKLIAVISAMVMALALVLAGCSDPSSSSNDSSGNGATAGSSGTDSGSTGGSGSSSETGSSGNTGGGGSSEDGGNSSGTGSSGNTGGGGSSEDGGNSSGTGNSGNTGAIKDLIVCDHEVTRGEYKEVVGSDPSKASAYDKDGNELTGDYVLNNPVNYVSWYDALVYCNKLSKKEGLTPCYTISDSTDPDKWGTVPTSGNDATWDAAVCDFDADGYRLPTDAEWECLARGGESYTYAGSNTVEDVAWCNTNGTREVKTKQANGYGLYDMSGNVDEWCWDWYSSISSSTDAAGAASGSFRVARGGCWYLSSSYCQVSFRDYGPPYFRGSFCGFRVVRSAN